MDARAELEQNPHLWQHKSLVVDLAYSEFCQRREAGEEIDPFEFCERFPSYRSSLRRRMSCDGWCYGLREQIPEKSELIIWPEPNETFGQYTILRRLGYGTFAQVYLATEATTGNRPVVLKISVESNTEAWTQGRLSHPHIVPVLSAREHESGFSMVCMPYLGNATLHSVLDRAYPTADSRPPRQGRIVLDAVRAAAAPGDPPLDLGKPSRHVQKGTWVNAVAHLGERLAVALAYVHEQGICHRDLKPSNILLDAAARPLLLDFNLSEDERLDRCRVGGTIQYMAPEQLRRILHLDPEAPPNRDGRADLFALGVILYELLTGQHPFGAMSRNLTPTQTANLLLERQVAGCTPLRSLNPEVDRRLAALIESCLAYEVKDRPASAAKMAAVLQRRLAPPRWKRMLLGMVSILILLTSGILAMSAVITPRVLTPDEEYTQGCLAYDSGDYQKADGCFDRALKADPNNLRFRFASGRTQLALHRPFNAENTFAQAYVVDSEKCRRLQAGAFVIGGSVTKKPVEQACPLDGRILAAKAYSELLAGHPQAAIVDCTQALDHSVGFTTAEVYTIRASAYMRYQPHINMYLAEGDLFKALKRDPNSVPGHYLRAHLALQKWQQERGTNPNALMPEEAPEDIEFVFPQRAVILGHDEYAFVHLEASWIYAVLAASPASEQARKGREHLRLAVLGGLDKERFMSAEKDTIYIPRLGAEEVEKDASTLPDYADTAPLIPSALLAPDPIKGWLN